MRAVSSSPFVAAALALALCVTVARVSLNTNGLLETGAPVAAVSPPADAASSAAQPTPHQPSGSADAAVAAAAGHGRRLMAADSSVGEILLNMVLPSAGATALGSSSVPRPSRSQHDSLGGGLGGSGGIVGSWLELSPAGVAALEMSLEAAWSSRSRYRPRPAGPAPAPPSSTASPHAAPAAFARTPPSAAADVTTSLTRLGPPPPGLLAALRQRRRIVPVDPDPLSAAKAEAKVEAKGGRGGSNGTRPLLALVLPSTVEWPARLDVAVAALVALETSSGGLGGPFDVVVVLDSEVLAVLTEPEQEAADSGDVAAKPCAPLAVISFNPLIRISCLLVTRSSVVMFLSRTKHQSVNNRASRGRNTTATQRPRPCSSPWEAPGPGSTAAGPCAAM